MVGSDKLRNLCKVFKLLLFKKNIDTELLVSEMFIFSLFTTSLKISRSENILNNTFEPKT